MTRLLPLLAATLTGLLCLGTANASSDGVTVIETVNAGPERVRAIFSDIQRAAKLSPNIVSLSSKVEGRCQKVEALANGGLLGDVAYTSLRCPTATGWTESLIASKDFSAYEYSVDLVEDAGKTRITLRSRVRMRARIPGVLIDRSVRKALRDTVEALRKELRTSTVQR